MTDVARVCVDPPSVNLVHVPPAHVTSDHVSLVQGAPVGVTCSTGNKLYSTDIGTWHSKFTNINDKIIVLSLRWLLLFFWFTPPCLLSILLIYIMLNGLMFCIDCLLHKFSMSFLRNLNMTFMVSRFSKLKFGIRKRKWDTGGVCLYLIMILTEIVMIFLCINAINIFNGINWEGYTCRRDIGIFNRGYNSTVFYRQMVDVAGPILDNIDKGSAHRNPSLGKLYVVMTFLAMIFVTFSKFNSGKTRTIYRDVKYRNIFLKSRKRHRKDNLLFILPKLLFCFYVFSSNDKDKLTNFNDLSQASPEKELFSNEFFSFCDDNTFSNKNLPLYALSKLKLKNHNSFFKYILLLSGDINLNPGPIMNPCKICKKSVRKKVIFCQICNYWYHKKCELPNETKYKELLTKVPNKPLYTCKDCSKDQNLMQNLPFYSEESILENCQDFIMSPTMEDNERNKTINKEYDLFKKRGLHFIHININSILSKIEELKLIASKTKAAIIGISESKLDETVLNGEIQISGYNLVRSDRNRHGGGVLCYIRNDLCFNQRENFSTEFENIFIDILLPKTKPILIGILYRPPDQSGFLDKLSNAINDTTNFDNQEVYILGDLNLNLIFKTRSMPNGIQIILWITWTKTVN